MRDLTDKQREVLGFMRSFVAKHGVPPTVREIGDRFKVTPRAAFDHLRALERKGALQRRVSAGRTSRALTLTDPPARATRSEERRVGSGVRVRHVRIRIETADWPVHTPATSRQRECRRRATTLTRPRW